jgi:DNA-binding transcriptional ArsR family regulator
LVRRLGDIAPSTLSHHLGRLIEVGLVIQERRTTTLLCRANYPSMRGIVRFLTDECCADSSTRVCHDSVIEAKGVKPARRGRKSNVKR